MSPPTVYDSKGRALEVGSRVERVLRSRVLGRWRGAGGIAGEVLYVARDGWVTVSFVRDAPTAGFPSERRFTLRRSFRCPDLLLITDDEKRDGPNAA